jgi:hypothetical protein
MLMASVRAIALAMLLAVPAAAPALAAPQRALTTAQLVDFCHSLTMAEAEGKASALGWGKMDDHVNDGWRQGYLSMNGGSVDVITWRRSDMVTEALSFWIAIGESSQRVCAYSTKNPAGLLDSLNDQFGKPSSVLKHDFGEVVFWTKGSMEVSFSRIDSSAGVTISYDF